MKEAIVHPGTRVTVVDSPIPKPKDGHVVIKVMCCGCNPKDFKVPEWFKVAMNHGDDIAGVVHSVGENVSEFKPGDRVAALHELVAPHGAYAEYAMAPAYTTFHIPTQTSFEEAATIPLACMTAAIGLYLSLGLPEPWRPTFKAIPLIVYGASGAVGSFAIKLAQLSNIHPIIAVAGKSKEFVEGMLNTEKGDVAIDYRQDGEAFAYQVKEALQKTGFDKIEHALDCMSEKAKGSYPNILKVLDPKGHITLMQNYDANDMPDSVTHSRMTVRWVFQDVCSYSGSSAGPDREEFDMSNITGCKDFGYVMSRFFWRALQNGWLKGHPYEVVPGGLGGLQTALEKLKAGKASGAKYVVRIAETEGYGEAVSAVNGEVPVGGA